MKALCCCFNFKHYIYEDLASQSVNEANEESGLLGRTVATGSTQPRIEKAHDGSFSSTFHAYPVQITLRILSGAAMVVTGWPLMAMFITYLFSNSETQDNIQKIAGIPACIFLSSYILFHLLRCKSHCCRSSQ